MNPIEFKSEKAQRRFKMDLLECGIHPLNIEEFNFEGKDGKHHYTIKVVNLVNNTTGLAWEV